MPLIATRGASSVQGFGQFAQATAVNYIEDVFSTYLWAGTGANRTITNGIDLSTKGGLVWIKSRNFADNHNLFDTTRGVTNRLFSNLTNAQSAAATSLTAFTSSGFSLGSNGAVNADEFLYASWTFRKQPKFFDVVTWTGTGSNTTIAHALGSVPGCIMVKRTDTSAAWTIYHRSLANTQYIVFNNQPAATNANRWNSTTPTSTEFSLGTDVTVNDSGGTYVAYIFAHDAGGFGLAGTDNVISCGSFTTDGAGRATVSLGYEPQWIMTKNSSDAGYQWQIWDSMRGLTVGGNDKMLQANLDFAEENNNVVEPSATGFSYGVGPASNTFIYITIRRGPMKVPTTGTSVFTPIARTGTGAAATVTLGNRPDLLIGANRASAYPFVYDRLRGVNRIDQALGTYSINSESEIGAPVNTVTALNNITYAVGTDGSGFSVNNSGVALVSWSFTRAPSFFDEVCYTGTGSARTVSHNLTVVPELMIVKQRGATGTVGEWWTYHPVLGNTKFLVVNADQAEATFDLWNNTSPTSTVFSVSNYGGINRSGTFYVAYLFSTCAGVSKVGSYTGTATTKQIDCGFTAGARFVLIKRTDSTGDWYVWDTARGIVSGNDPYLLLNSTAAEVTNTDYIDTYNAGFELSSTAPAAINANGGTYIFLAIA